MERREEGKEGKVGDEREGRKEGKGEERESKKGNELDARPGGPRPSGFQSWAPSPSAPGPSWCPRTVRVPVLGNPDLVPQDWMP